MKLVFASNYLNHHQLPLALNFRRMLGDNFVFIATKAVSDARINLGYADMDEKYDFVLPAYKSQKNEELAAKLINKCDILICGSVPEHMVAQRINDNKIVFRYSERPLKNGAEPHKYFARLIKWRKRNPVSKSVYLLCASAYAAADYKCFGMFKNRAYKWGYFPDTAKYNSTNELMSKKDANSILWCGRLIDWKHPETAVMIAQMLKADGYKFTLNIIGDGDLKPQLKQLIDENDLCDYVKLAGAVAADEVRKYMESAGVFLFTSGFQEGWGAVLNEAMNSGCAVVASSAAGAVPYLIENGKNGLIYQNNNIDEMYKSVKYLLNNVNEQQRLGSNAYNTIAKLWCADVAAERFIALAQCIENNSSCDIFDSGPCSKAEIISNNWFKTHSGKA